MGVAGAGGQMDKLAALSGNMDTRASMNRDEYIKLAEVEDRMWYFRSLHRHVRRGFEAAHLADNARVLDAGCGTGGLLLRMREWNPQWQRAGLDFMPIACELARQRGAGDICEGSITELPYGDAEFDAVVSADVICQVDDDARAAREFFRVLRPGGVVVINVPAYMWMWSYHDDSCQTRRRYTRPTLRAVLAGAGFTDIRATHWNALPMPLLVAKRKLFRSSADTSDVKLYPAPIEAALNGVMAIEHAWRALGGNWAWGTSVYATARKPV